MLGVKPAEGMAVKYEGMTARRTTAGTIEAETQSFTNLTNELEEMRKKPAETNSNFTPTPFDLHRYMNSDVANSHEPQPIQNTTGDPKTISNLQLVHKAVQEIERFLGRKININSGFRTKELNEVLPGSSSESSHMQGYVADFYAPAAEHKEIMKYLKNNMIDENRVNNGLPILNQAISYPHRNFFHIDINPKGTKKSNPKDRYKEETANRTIVPYKFDD